MMEIEVKVTLKNIEEIEAEVAKMLEGARAKIASGEIEVEEDTEPESEDENGSDGTGES